MDDSRDAPNQVLAVASADRQTAPHAATARLRVVGGRLVAESKTCTTDDDVLALLDERRR